MCMFVCSGEHVCAVMHMSVEITSEILSTSFEVGLLAGQLRH